MDNDNLSDTSASFVKLDISDVLGREHSDSSILSKEMYDPSTKEQICCIEMVNNNKLHIKYDLEWTISDVTKINSANIRHSSK
jgi:hypothetical protein